MWRDRAAVLALPEHAMRERLTLILLIVIAVAQLATLAMVGHVYFTMYRVASAFSSVGKTRETTEAPTEPLTTTEVAIPTEPDTGDAALAALASPTDVEPLWSVEYVHHELAEVRASENRFTWTAKVRNDSDKALAFDATITFKDRDGRAIATAEKSGVVVSARQSHIFGDATLVRRPEAEEIVAVSIDMSRRSDG
jgi:hypothetical protein